MSQNNKRQFISYEKTFYNISQFYPPKLYEKLEYTNEEMTGYQLYNFQQIICNLTAYND